MSEGAGGDMELKVWKGDWGLPSVDHHCLAAMAYCKFSEAPLKISQTSNPFESTLKGSLATFLQHDLTSGYLPVLVHDDEKDSEVADILTFLRKQGWGTDHTLSSKQSADIVAYTAMMETKLLPALDHLWWVDSKTYTELTLPWFARTLPFPLSMYLPRRTHKQCVARLTLAQGGATDQEENNHMERMLRDAKECLNLLSSKLADQDFFFGSRPSSLDAVVFGYLAPLIKAPLPTPTLQNHLRGCPNLVQLCTRILNTYFPLSPQELQEQKAAEEKQRRDLAVDPEYPNKRRNTLLAGAVALTAMLTYALLTGIIQINMEEETLPKPPDFAQFDSYVNGDNNRKRGDAGDE